MNKMLLKNFQTGIILLMVVVVLVASGCQKEKQEKEAKTKKTDTLEILYTEWPEGVAFTFLAKAVLEDRGINTNIKARNVGVVYNTLAKGEADLYLSAWLPHTHSEYWVQYGENLNKIGESFAEGMTGLVVPGYMDIDSISQLDAYSTQLNGKIYGIGSDAGIHTNTVKAIKEYDLDYRQITASEAAMIATLSKAYYNEEPIVVTGWKPHPMWKEFDLKFLNDSKNVYPSEVCNIISRQGFRQDYPEVYKFFTNFYLEESQLYDLMETTEQSKNKLKAARKWYKDSEELINSWLPDELKE